MIAGPRTRTGGAPPGGTGATATGAEDTIEARGPSRSRSARYGPRRPAVIAARLVAAATWRHQGAWAKLADRQPWQRAVVARLPGIGASHARLAARALGVGEVLLAAWTLSGRAPRANATAQVAGLAGVKLGGRLLTGRWQPSARHAILTSGAGLVCAATSGAAPPQVATTRRHAAATEVIR